jgi:predicted acylesterase/phospholipase RssA
MAKCLSLGSGSMGLFIELGVLSKLRVDQLEEISGASAGALLAFLFIVTRGDIPKMLDFALNAPIKQMMMPNIRSLLKDYGLIPQAKIRAVFADCVAKFLNGRQDITFVHLYELFPIKLHVTAYCVELQKTCYFSVDTTPDVLLVDALTASMAIPLLVSTVKIDGWTYLDGGVEEEDPCGCFLGRPADEVLRLRVSLQLGTAPVVKDYKSYLVNIVNSLLKMRYKYQDFPSIEVASPPGIDINDFGLGNEDKLRLFLAGHNTCMPSSVLLTPPVAPPSSSE